MKQVTIRRCPVCQNIGNLANSVAATLRNDKDTEVQVVDGAKGEFTVEVDGQEVQTLKGEMLPTTDEVVNAVHGGVGTTA
jgi:hypothetical protein